MDLIVFSTFILKEKKSAVNIKDRKNRHNVIRILEMIENSIDLIKQENKNGVFIFAGIDEYDDEIFEIIKPTLLSTMFYYNCGSKFVTDLFYKYFDEYDGTIIFANGEKYMIYIYDNNNGKFELKFETASRICNKHNKGGSSSGRFGRIADNIREKYILSLIESISKIETKNNWIFGSNDILSEIFIKNKMIKNKIKNGWFVDFDKTTINSAKKFIDIIKNKNYDDFIIEKIIENFDTNIDVLNFDLNYEENINNYEYVILTPLHKKYCEIESNEKIIKLQSDSKFYGKLKAYHCINKLYFSNNYDF